MIAAIVSLGLAHLLARCAPSVGPVTMSAVITYESGGRRFAIADNTVHRSYFPTNRARAVTIATSLLDAGHNIDVGYAQINSGNFASYGLDASAALDPCTNVATGAHILQRAYAGAVRRYGRSEAALAHALSAYNSGGYFAGMGYARAVYATAATLRYECTRSGAASCAGARPSVR